MRGRAIHNIVLFSSIVFILTTLGVSLSIEQQLLDPFWWHYNISQPQWYSNDGDVPRTSNRIIFCVCNDVRDMYFTHVMFSQLPLLTGVRMLVASKSWCAGNYRDANASTLLVDAGCSSNGASFDKYPNTTLPTVYLRRSGEVMGAHSYRCAPHQEVAYYRGLDVLIGGCETIHALQIAQTLFGWYVPLYGSSPTVARLTVRKTMAEVLALVSNATKFAAYSFGKFKCCGYYGEFIFRHAIVDALHNYTTSNFGDEDRDGVTNVATVQSVGHFALHGKAHPCKGSFDEAPKCFANYKFGIVMENSHIAGYVSEKLLNAVLAGAIPVYFGAPDIFRYVNRRALIHCDITIDERTLLRTNNDKFNNSLPHESVKLARTLVADAVDKCVAKIVAIDSDVDSYMQMLAEPLFDKPHWPFIDGLYTSCQMAHVLEKIRPGFLHLNNTLCVDDLHKRNRK